MASDHHWIGDVPDPEQYFGFIYIITDLDERVAYVGKKQYFMARRVKGCKSKVTDRQATRWKSCCWKGSDWKSYKGSSKNLQAHIATHPNHNYEFRIIRQCRSKGTLHYAEVEALVALGTLWRRDKNGDAKFFNRQIPATRFRPPAFYADGLWLVDFIKYIKELENE